MSVSRLCGCRTLVGWAVALATFMPLATKAAAADPRPEAFAARFEIVATTSGPYFRLPLSSDVARYSRTADLADLRVYNAAGELLPFALLIPGAEKPAESATALPVYPIESGVLQASIAGSRLEIRQRGGATTVVIEGDRKADPAAARVAAYLLDAREVSAQAVAIELDAEFDRARLVPVMVQASRDLKHWRTLASGEPVFRLAHGSTENVRTTVRFARAAPLDGEYLRLTWSDATRFDLRGATLKTVPAAIPPPPPPLLIDLGAATQSKGREVDWTLATPLRFAQLQLRAAEMNTLAPVTIMGQPRAGEPWRAIGRGVAYRIERDGAELVNPPIDVVAGSYVGIRVVLDDAAPAFGAPPRLGLLLPPREVVFLARGAGPYALAVGQADIPRAALPLASLVPDYQREAERMFPLATLGVASVDATRLPQTPSRVFGFDGRTVTLWAVLIGAVLLLSAFAFTLLRKADRAQANKTSDRS